MTDRNHRATFISESDTCIGIRVPPPTVPILDCLPESRYARGTVRCRPKSGLQIQGLTVRVIDGHAEAPMANILPLELAPVTNSRVSVIQHCSRMVSVRAKSEASNAIRGNGLRF